MTRNVFFRNDKDLCIEVTHGPCLVDGNILASPFSITDMAQVTAFVHNLICGYTFNVPVLDRPTPDHFPHTTAALGCAVTYGGDDRFFNNIFTCNRPLQSTAERTAGTAVYDRYSSPEDYPRLLAIEGNTDEQKFYKVPQPVWAEGNVYGGSALPCRHEKNALPTPPFEISIRLENDGCLLIMDSPEEIVRYLCQPVTSEYLGLPRITEEGYENPDDSPIDFTRALDGRREAVQPGPFSRKGALLYGAPPPRTFVRSCATGKRRDFQTERTPC